ncbi:MAG: GntP family permease, partial [Proteobacteria bacterium]
MLAIFGILLSLVLLMYLAYRGFSVIVLAPALALLAVAWTGEFPLLATYTEVFMKHLAGFVKAFFPLFLLGAIFGSLMSASGFAERIARQISGLLGARHAILSVVLSCAVLTYGGVSLFVVAFAVYPIAAALYRQAGIPKRLIPASLALGSFTFTMVALPGTPQIQNSIPMPYFGTTLYAAPIIGTVVGLWMAVAGTLWLQYRARKLQAAGEGYGNHADDTLAVAAPERGGFSLLPWIPVILVLSLSFVFSNYIFPSLNLDYL